MINQSIHRIQAISKNTFREAIRDKILYNLIVFVLILTASAIFLSELTAGHQTTTVASLGLVCILIFGSFIAIFVGIGLVSKEIEKKTVANIFSKPVSRSEFIIGKYLGLSATLFVNTIIMATGLSLAVLFTAYESEAGGAPLALSLWASVYLIFLKLLILTAVAVLFSTFSSPALSALFSMIIFIIGNFTGALKEVSEYLQSSASTIVFNAVYYILPNFSFFSFNTQAAHGDVPPLNMVSTASIYCLVYVSILLFISMQIFKRRNFK